MVEQDQGQGGGLNDRAFAPATDESLSGTGGSSGGGALSGGGEISGADTDRQDDPLIGRDGRTLAATGELAGTSDDQAARDAAALGGADGSLAEAAAGGASGTGAPTMGDAVGGGAGRDVGGGTPGDRGELGGGAPLGRNGGTGPAGSGSPGGDSRR
jgi:hypothetical protein